MLLIATVKPLKKGIEKKNYIRAVMNDSENDVVDKFTFIKQLSRKFLLKKTLSGKN